MRQDAVDGASGPVGAPTARTITTEAGPHGPHRTRVLLTRGSIMAG